MILTISKCSYCNLLISNNSFLEVSYRPTSAILHGMVKYTYLCLENNK